MNKPQEKPFEHEASDADQEADRSKSVTGSRPSAKFSGSGGVSVAVWKSKSDAGFDNYSVQMERVYRKEDGSFATTKMLRDSDLLRAQKLLGEADAWIEQDKAKSRGQTSGVGSNSPAR